VTVLQVGISFASLAINLECYAYNCEMPSGKSDTTCSAATCSCPNGCSGMDLMAASIESSTMMCDSSGVCNLEIQGLPPGMSSFEVVCSAGECLEASLVLGMEAPRPARPVTVAPPLNPGLAVIAPSTQENCDGRKVMIDFFFSFLSQPSW